ACGSCILTSKEDPSYGPVVASPNLIDLNTAGCLAATGDVDCGKDFQANAQCDDLACAAACLLDDSEQSFMNFENCATAASNTVCGTYDDKVDMCLGSIARDASAEGCVNGDFKEEYLFMANLFCGM